MTLTAKLFTEAMMTHLFTLEILQCQRFLMAYLQALESHIFYLAVSTAGIRIFIIHANKTSLLPPPSPTAEGYPIQLHKTDTTQHILLSLVHVASYLKGMCMNKNFPFTEYNYIHTIMAK